LEAYARQGATLADKIPIFLARFSAAVQGLPEGGTANSSILFIILLAILFWALGLNAAYALIRLRDAWRAMLPLSAVLLLFYASTIDKSSGQIYLVIFLLTSLLLVARAHFLDLKIHWEDNRIQTPAYVGVDFFRTSTYIALGLLVLAWLLPGIFRSAQSGEVGWNILLFPFAAVNDSLATNGSGSEELILGDGPSYGTTLALGRGNPLGEETVLTVRPLGDQAPATRYYWRDRVYDYYSEGEWFSTFTEEQLFAPSQEPLPYPEWEGRRLERFTIVPSNSLTQFHAPSEPVWLDAPAFLQYQPNPDGSLDIQALISPLTRSPGEGYQVESWVTRATQQQLADAGTDYPDWILERYLQVPDEITERTRSLAVQVAEGAQNPYEIAVTVTEYLRDNITYREVIDVPPANQETVDWLLFDYRQGFCNYYASAEVILLRLLGIPARFAAGYAEGEAVFISAEERSRDLNIETEVSGVDFFTVRQRDAHAWPEVFFPGIGWVEFEPTVSQQPLGRPPGDQEGSADPEEQSTPEAAQQDGNNPLVALWLRLGGMLATSPYGLLLITILPTVLLAGLLLWQRHRRRGGQPIPVLLERRLQAYELQSPGFLRKWARYASLPALPRTYQEVNRSLHWLGMAASPGLAPAERTERLAEILPQLSEMITSLGRVYEQSLYSQKSEDVEGLGQARWKLRFATLVTLSRRASHRIQQAPQRWLTGRNPTR
jgi:transglutaminase-like putative cysteine protease